MLKKFAEVYGVNNNFSSLNEAKEPDMVIPADDSSDIKEEADIIGGILKKAGVDAKCKAGLDQVEIHLKDKKDAKKAQKAIEKAGYQVGWNESEVHEAKVISSDMKDKVLQTLIDISAELGDSDVDDYMADIEAATDEMGAEDVKLKQIVVNLVDKYAHFGTELVKAIALIKKL